MNAHIVLTVALCMAACKVPDGAPITSTWTETFDRKELGSNYRPTAEAYSIVDGVLVAQRAYNHPLWLRKRLPKNVMIELDVTSHDRDGDMKVELFGDGEYHATDKGQYTSTGYVAVMGGWRNSKSILARGNEHGNTLAERTEPAVKKGTTYRWKLVRRGNTLEWSVDDQPFLKLTDESPLYGPGHFYFAFNNWQAETRFDNLKITPLAE